MAKPRSGPKRKSKFDFLALPAELRNQIYRYIVPTRAKVKPKIRVKGRHDVVLNKILRLNKAINRETNTLLYADNQFELSSPKQALLFLQRIGSINCSMISHIDLRNWNFSTREVHDAQLEWLFGTNHHDKAKAVRQFMTWVATKCPNLTYLSLSQVWIFPTEPCWALQHEPVKKYEHLVRCFPKLLNIEYSRRSQILVLSAKPMTNELKTAKGYVKFDVEKLIKDLAAKDAARAATATRVAARAAARIEAKRLAETKKAETAKKRQLAKEAKEAKEARKVERAEKASLAKQAKKGEKVASKA